MARLFNVPLGMLNDVLSKPETYASAEQADIRFVKHVIRPWCTRIEQKVNVTVLSSQDALTCTHDLTDLYRGDLLSLGGFAVFLKPEIEMNE
jgi:phage portal protein BeeE